MKMDFHYFARVTAVFILSALTVACGKQPTASGTFEKASEECVGEAIPKQFIVRYKDGRIEKVNAPSKEEFINGFLTENLDQIEYAEHDYFVHAGVPVKQDEIKQKLSQSMWADNWGAERVGAQHLWQQNIRGASITVAVIDTGMDLTHSQLKKRVATNSGEQGLDNSGRDRASNGVDDDGNGFVDDALGYDFARSRPLQGDYTYHGSHVSGIIAAEHSDTTAQGAPYVQGIAPQAKILPLAFLDQTGSGAMTDAVRAIYYAVARGARVINASWGGPGCSRSLQDAVLSLESRGIVFVAASGNESMNIDRNRTYPGSLDLPAQITVGAIGFFGNMSQYSNYGLRSVHIFAPGDAIVSTVQGGLASLDGTSMAAPFVSGPGARCSHLPPVEDPGLVRFALPASGRYLS